MFVGTKLDGRVGGASIPVLLFDANTGSLARQHFDAAHLPAPSWLALGPSGSRLYAACRAESLSEEPTGVGSDDPKDHFVAAFEIDAVNGMLSPLGEQRPTVGIGPTHCGTNGRLLVTAQYMGGSVTSFSLTADGSILPTRCVCHHEYGSNANPVRQGHSYCHAAVFDHSGDRVLVPDLGADRLYCYEADSSGQLIPAPGGAYFESAPASGPRSVCFHSKNPSWCYLINEIDSTIVPLQYDVSDGKLVQLGPNVLTIPEDWPGLDVDATGRPKIAGEAPRGLKGNLTAHIEVHPK